MLVAGLFCFYKFMTYDRNYAWSKEYKVEIITIAGKTGFKITQTDAINVGEIKRSTEKTIKIRIQKILSKVNLMKYGQEFGERTTFISASNKGSLICKAWCLDDHLIGLEMEYANIDVSTFTSLKAHIEKRFINYKIIWTQLPDE